jgi:hypothetical protein
VIEEAGGVVSNSMGHVYTELGSIPHHGHSHNTINRLIFFAGPRLSVGPRSTHFSSG